MSCKRIKSEEAVPMFVPPVEAPEDIVRDAVPDAATTGVPDEVSDVVPKNVAKEPTNDVQELPIGPAFNDFEDCGVYVVRRVLEDQNYHVEYKKPSRSSLGEVPRRNHPLTKSEDSRLLLEWQPDWIAREYFSDAFYEEMAYLYEIFQDSIDFSSGTKLEFNYSGPRHYHVLVSNGNSSSRGGEILTDSPGTSGTSVTGAPSCGSGYSTGSSSPLSITKELTNVASPLTPLTNVSGSKSKSVSPSRNVSFLEKSESPPHNESLQLDSEDNTRALAVSDEEYPITVLNRYNEKVSLTSKHTDPLTSRASEKRSFERSDSKNSLGAKKLEKDPEKERKTVEISPEREKRKENGVERKKEKSPPTISQVFTNGHGTLLPSTKTPKINIRIGGEASKTKEITAKNLKITLGGKELVKRPLVSYTSSSDSSDGEDETAKPSTSNGIRRESSDSVDMPKRTIGPSLIGPSLPSKDQRDRRSWTEEPKKREEPSGAAIKRTASMNGDTTSVKRRRLLSERGEKEAEYPVLDDKTNDIFTWKGFAHLNRVRGVGLVNNANDCFLNVILQMLTHTPAIARYAFERHQDDCERGRSAEQCVCCAFKKNHLSRVFNQHQNAFAASWIRPHLRRIFPAHMHGMQEDAHELLSLLLDAFDPPPGKNNHMPNGLRKKPSASTPIEQIFGGTLRNQITCNRCGTPTVNYERIREFNLAIRKRPDEDITLVSHLIEQYFREEIVANWDCKRCGEKTHAKRRTRLLRPPEVLIVQLKRFNAFGSKIKLPVKPDLSLDLSGFHFENSSGSSGNPCEYVLTSVAVHLGSGVDHGHYVAYTRGFRQEQWFLFDDDIVQSSSSMEVQKSQPYLLVYCKKGHVQAGGGMKPGRNSFPMMNGSLKYNDAANSSFNHNRYGNGNGFRPNGSFGGNKGFNPQKRFGNRPHLI